MSQQRVTAPFNITVSLVLLLISVVFFALMIGVFPQSHYLLERQRLSLCETIALNTTLAIQRRDRPLAEQMLAAAVNRNPALQQAELLRTDDELVHREGQLPTEAKLDEVSVPIAVDQDPWGTLRLHFVPLQEPGFWNDPLVRFLSFVLSAGFLVMFIYLRRVLQYLDPSRVIPERVRTTLDTLAEGLVVLDPQERIVLANNAFAKHFELAPEELIGRDIRSIDWVDANGDFPWTQAIRDQQVVTGQVVLMAVHDGQPRTMRVNSAPIIAEDGCCQGALTSFDDVTSLEQRTVALTQMLERLRISRDRIRRQNEELHVLATRDPLTTALNRRSFFDQVEPVWVASAKGQPLSCALLDIDHFKRVNDNHGHALGDEVLKTTVAILQQGARPGDLICRYGGEEFCVVFPKTDADGAAALCERYRHDIERHAFSGIQITASFGISSIASSAADVQQMIDQADHALYWAKRNGRNQVARFDELPDDFDLDTDVEHHDSSQMAAPISHQAVASLLSALAYRDVGTAEHSRRVADLCVQMAEGLMSCSESYILENAALLHDIGKIGVPDSILLKPAPLTEAEWEVMRSHDKISVEIIRSTFACDELTETVKVHHAWFGGHEKWPDLPVGTDIPLGARILSIADSYDAMTSDRVYRKGRTREEAFEELRRCAATQFDPHLVERFIAIVGCTQAPQVHFQQTTDKKSALRLGREIENLARAIDDRDTAALRRLAVRVRSTAEQYNIEQIQELADELHDTIGTDNDDWLNTLELTIELIELCRQTQRVHLNTCATKDSSLRNSGLTPNGASQQPAVPSAN